MSCFTCSFHLKKIKKKVISTDEPNTLKSKAAPSEICLLHIVTEYAHADEFQNILKVTSATKLFFVIK